VVCVGRLSAEKGLDVVFAGLRAVQERAATRVVCAVAGDGPHAEQYQRMAPSGTRFVGRLSGSALSAFFASADLFLFPSVTDTFGNVVLEAMASGVPVIGAEVGPTCELLAAGGGVTFPREDADAFASCVVALADDPARRRSLALRALDVAHDYKWDRVFDDLMADYARVIVGAAPATSAAGASALLNPLPPRRLQH
jgi:glycosyltransferase involved in cell wall biosynthesis